MVSNDPGHVFILHAILPVTFGILKIRIENVEKELPSDFLEGFVRKYGNKGIFIPPK